MKIIASLFFLPVLAFGQKDKFEIKGQVSGLPNGEMIYLIDANNPTDTLSRDVLKAGKFNLKGSIKEPNLHHINFGTKKKNLLFVGNDDIKLEGNVEDLKNMSVKGSRSHDDFVEFQKIFNPLFQRYTELNRLLKEKGYTILDGRAQPNGLTDSLNKLLNIAYNDIHNKLDEFVSTHRSSYVGAFALVVTQNINDNPLLLQKRFNLLDEKVQKGYFGSYLKTTIDDAMVGAIGTEAIDFTQNDVDGKPVQLSSLRGKYVLIDFWASWCGPCRMENPNVVMAYNKFKDKNFTILGVSLDRAKESWLKAIQEDQLAWTQVSDLKFWQNEVAQKYKIVSIPQNFLVAPDGKIVAKNLRGPALDSKLCELLGCN